MASRREGRCRRDPFRAPSGGRRGGPGSGLRGSVAGVGGGTTAASALPQLQVRPAFEPGKALADAGYTATLGDQEILLSILRRIEPHPEVPAALDRLRARYRLAVISNTDDDLIAGTVAAIRTPIDFVTTAQQAQAYKPDHRLFLHAYSTMGVTKDETVHVGMGQFTDLKVCHELGIRSVWINRAGDPPNPDWLPDAELDDLSGLPDLLLPS